MIGGILYFTIGFLFARALGLIKDFGAFCNLVIVIIGWPFCIIAASIVMMVWCIACVVDAFKGGVK